MIGLELAQDQQAYVALGILLGMMVFFVRETLPLEVVAIGGAALMMVLGILPVADAGAVLSNSAPWTIALMFMVMGGLVRTGAVEQLIALAERHVGDRPRLTVAVLFGGMVASRMNCPSFLRQLLVIRP